MGLGNEAGKTAASGKAQKKTPVTVKRGPGRPKGEKRDANIYVRMTSDFKKELKGRALDEDITVQDLSLGLFTAYVSSGKSYKEIIDFILGKS